jgi:hypothetical protein
MERRIDGRATLEGAFANKFIDGIPHTVQILDASSSGLRVRRILEPETSCDTFPVELMLGGVRLFAWTKRVWRRGDREALRIMAAEPLDRARLRKFLRNLAA